MNIKRSTGRPFPFGATTQENGFNFALYAPLATQVTLVIYHPVDGEATSEYVLSPGTNRTGQVWHIHITGLDKQIRYGYRVSAPSQLSGKVKPDSHIILLDPYSKITCGGKIWGQPQKINRNGKFYTFRLGGIPNQEYDWEEDSPINTSLQDTIIYELHVRGFTMHHTSGVKNPGTFEGLIEKIPYLQKLGITAVELMPVTDFDETHPERINPDTGEPLHIYWGYDPISFFAPKEAYSAQKGSCGSVISFKNMVKAFHQAGIEVILDMVFNHTGEGNHLGPVFNFKNLGSRIFYLINEDGEFVNYSGCGNTLNCNHTVVKEMVLDSLRYWVTEMHVDGFRFDLASILGRGRDGSVLNNPPLIERITEDPILANVKLIAEAWDAAGLYQVGEFPGGKRWMEWNGQFRDDVRRYLRGDPEMIPKMATRLAGSSDLYEDDGREPYHSVNFVTCHDGFSLNDLVSYNTKHNMANGEDNLDGNNLNFSWNCGVEGETQDEKILVLRQKQIRNFAALLLLSQGVPMIYAGDEFSNSKGGNNNTYCQDNETDWLNWANVNQNKDLVRFFRHLIQFRKDHANMRRSSFIVRERNGQPEMNWHGSKLNQPDWSEKSTSLALHYTPTENDPYDIFLILNGGSKKQSFQLPKISTGLNWRLIMNTANHSPEDIYGLDKALPLNSQKNISVRDRSLVLLISKEF